MNSTVAHLHKMWHQQIENVDKYISGVPFLDMSATYWDKLYIHINGIPFLNTTASLFDLLNPSILNRLPC